MSLFEFGGDDRGVSEVLGSVLIFGLLILLVVLLQVSLVPSLNQQAEFEHNQRVHDDMDGLQSGVLRVASTASPETVPVELGVRYSSRLFLLNPPPASGSFRTEPSTVTFSGLTAASDDADDVWNGTQRTYQGEDVVYRPHYNEYRNAPETVYESSLLYNRFDGAVRVVNRGSLVSGNRITLVSLDGSVSESSVSSEAFRLDPLSAPTRSVSVSGPGTPDPSDDPRITVRSRLNASQWSTIYADEFVDAGEGGHIADITDAGPGAVTIHLQDGVEYSLRMGRVGLNERGTETDARYVASDVDKALETGADGRVKLAVEARDDYNNGKSNQNVTFSGTGDFETEGGDVLGTNGVTVQTDDSGRVTVWFDPATTPTTVDAYLGDAVLGVDADNPKRVSYSVVAPGETPPGTVGEGEGSNVVVFEGASASDGSNTIAFALNNRLTGPSPGSDVKVVGVRLEYISAWERPGGGTGSSGSPTLTDGPNQIAQLQVVRSGQPTQTKTLSSPADETSAPVFFESSPMTLTAGQSTVRMTDQSYSLKNNEAVLVSVTYFYDGGRRATYTTHIFG